MKLEQFKSGEFRKQSGFRSFNPTTVNRQWSWENAQINTLLEDARGALAELNAFSFIVPDIQLFTQLHVVKEASLSSRIEGTQTTFDEALMDRDLIDPERRDDWQEVQNYISAMNFAIDKLKELPLSSRLLKEAHAVLMQAVRGQSKDPGEYRRSQNWIGGTSPSDAVFVPPSHEEVPDLMSDLEKFWHNSEIAVPHLIRAAISHYQFETIHPFLDGNGRIGRLLITLYLIDKNLLAGPSLYLSAYLEKYRTDYYDNLIRVRTQHDMSGWISFFLEAVLDTAVKGKQTFQDVLALRKEVEESVLSLKQRAHNARRLLTHLYRWPVITITKVMDVLEITNPTASALVDDLIRLEILEPLDSLKRGGQYGFVRYYSLFLG